MIKHKLMAIDLDGTLLSKFKKISFKNFQALNEYIQVGGNVVLTTGRSIVSAKKYAKQIDDFSQIKSKYVIAFNGGYIEDLINSTIIERKIPDKLVREIYKIAKENKCFMWAYTKEATDKRAVYTSKSFANWFVKKGKDIQLLKLNESVEDLSSYKVNLMSFSKKKIAKIHDILIKNFADQINISYSHTLMLEINLINVNKGTALQIVMDKLNVKKHEVAAIGDSNNDLPMLNAAGSKFAVKTKSPELISASDYYLKYKKNAVADIINTFILSDNREIKLIASDLDGTLLSSYTKAIVPEAKAAIEKAVDNKDCIFIVCTGRGLDDAILVADYLEVKKKNSIYVISANGGEVCDYGNNKVVFTCPMHVDLATQLYHIYDNFENNTTHQGEIGMELYTECGQDFLTNRKPHTHYLSNKEFMIDKFINEHPEALKNFWSEKEFSTLDKAPLDKVVKAIFHFDNNEDKARILALLEQLKDKIDISSSGAFNIEVTALNVNKGSSLKRLCTFLDIDLRQTMTIGDQKNDLSMLEISPHSVTLSSSSDNIKKAVSHVIDAKPGYVVAEAINKYVLGESND